MMKKFGFFLIFLVLAAIFLFVVMGRRNIEEFKSCTSSTGCKTISCGMRGNVKTYAYCKKNTCSCT